MTDYIPMVDCATCPDRLPIDEMVYADNSVLLVCRPCYRKAHDMLEGKGERFELFYFSGGHGGPYATLEDAVAAARARLRGHVREVRIDIKPYTEDGFGETIAVVRVMGWQDIDPDTIRVEYLRKPE